MKKFFLCNLFFFGTIVFAESDTNADQHHWANCKMQDVEITKISRTEEKNSLELKKYLVEPSRDRFFIYCHDGYVLISVPRNSMLKNTEE